MQDLPPHVKAHADRLIAAAPPLSPEQERFLQALFAPALARITACEQQAA